MPNLTDPDNREEVPPEDTPVKTRQQPGYEPVGIRAGSWMFTPTLISGGFYDSNVFSSDTLKRSDIAAVFEPSLRAHTLWEQHGIDLTLDEQSTVYQSNSGLNQTNASLKGNAWFDIAHDLTLLSNFQIAHLNVAVGTLSSPSGAVQPTPYNLLSGDVTLRKQFDRLTTSVGFRTDSYDYGSTQAQNGTIIDESGLDGQIYSVHGRLDYALSQTLGWFTGIEGNERDIRGTPGQPCSANAISTHTQSTTPAASASVRRSRRKTAITTASSAASSIGSSLRPRKRPTVPKILSLVRRRPEPSAFVAATNGLRAVSAGMPNHRATITTQPPATRSRVRGSLIQSQSE